MNFKKIEHQLNRHRGDMEFVADAMAILELTRQTKTVWTVGDISDRPGTYLCEVISDALKNARAEGYVNGIKSVIEKL